MGYFQLYIVNLESIEYLYHTDYIRKNYSVLTEKQLRYLCGINKIINVLYRCWRKGNYKDDCPKKLTTQQCILFTNVKRDRREETSGILTHDVRWTIRETSERCTTMYIWRELYVEWELFPAGNIKYISAVLKANNEERTSYIIQENERMR